MAGSLFTGIGGLDLGLERAQLCMPAWFAETDKFAASVLAQHYPNVPNLGDVSRIDWRTVPRVDVLHGGFPCQDISEAGQGRGIQEGNRSGLWFRFADAIYELGPRLVIVENVSALLGRGIDTVLGDLADLGFDAWWTVLRASDVGAGHLRERVFIVAIASHLCREGLEGAGPQVPPGRPVASGRSPDPVWGRYSQSLERWGRTIGRPTPHPIDAAGRLSVPFVEWHMGFPEGWVDGLSRSRALQVLGNAVVPQVAEVVGGWAKELMIQTAGKLTPGCPYCAPDENCPTHENLPTVLDARRVPIPTHNAETDTSPT
jgi:DNA (cytosine-5)-methyltransferase 1